MDARGCVVAIGNFDGIHKGHQVVIHEAGAIARAQGAPWAVMSFEPDRKSTRLNSSHIPISYAAFCLKQKK